jgi:iron complex transport system substrate-binding protein
MRATALALAAALALGGAAQAAPRRVMSMNACADLLVLELAPRERIVSVTYRARDAGRAFAPGLADGIPVNDGRPEEVAAFRPDLVVAGRFTTERTKALARRAGVPVLELEDANDFEGIRRNLRALGAALGAPAKAERLIARMDATLAAIPPAEGPPIPVLAWSGGGAVAGAGTLTDAVIRAAGAENLAARPGVGRDAGFDVEALLAARPAALLQADPRLTRPAVREAQGRHPVVRRLWRGRTIAIPETLYSCGLPQTAEAARDLAAALAALPAGRPAP